MISIGPQNDVNIITFSKVKLRHNNIIYLKRKYTSLPIPLLVLKSIGTEILSLVMIIKYVNLSEAELVRSRQREEENKRQKEEEEARGLQKEKERIENSKLENQRTSAEDAEKKKLSDLEALRERKRKMREMSLDEVLKLQKEKKKGSPTPSIRSESISYASLKRNSNESLHSVSASELTLCFEYREWGRGLGFVSQGANLRSYIIAIFLFLKDRVAKIKKFLEAKLNCLYYHFSTNK